MKIILEFIKYEIESMEKYISLYLEYYDSELVKDELVDILVTTTLHAKYWLELGVVLGLPIDEEIKYYNELCDIFKGGEEYEKTYFKY